MHNKIAFNYCTKLIKNSSSYLFTVKCKQNLKSYLNIKNAYTREKCTHKDFSQFFKINLIYFATLLPWLSSYPRLYNNKDCPFNFFGKPSIASRL